MYSLKANRKAPISHDATLYRQRHRIENMFGRLRLATYFNSLRPLRTYLLQRNLHRRDNHLLAQK
jgi:hypothetical protein